MATDDLTNSEHPGDPADDPEAYYENSLSKKFLKYVDSVFEVFHQLPEVHDEVLTEIVENRIAKLRSLSKIDEATLEQMEPIVAENTKFLYSREWSISWAKAQMTKPALEGFLFVSGYIIFPILAILVGTTENHLHIGNGLTFLASLFALIILGLATWLVASLLRLVTRGHGLGLRKILMAAALVWVTALSALDKDRISDTVQRFTHYTPHGVRLYYSKIIWATAIHNALWVIAGILVLRALYVFFEIFVRSLLLGKVAKSSRVVLYSAAVQDSLLDLASVLDKCVQAKKAGDMVSIPNETRTGVIDSIAEIANTIEGPWVRSLRTGYRDTDDRTAQVGSKIARSLRVWQSRAVFGGQYFETIRDDCISFYVNMVEGDWEKIGAGEEDLEGLRVAKYKTVLRRLTAMTLPVLLAFIVVKVLPASMGGYKPYLVLASIILAFVEIVALIDPDIVERINTVVNVTNSIRRPPKP